MPHPLHDYLAELHQNRRVGTPETSSYPALQALFNEVGKKLKPGVRCIIHPQSQGAGIPDGGFFTADQLQEDASPDLARMTTKPARGVLEVKGTSADVEEIINSDQAKKYLENYGLLLVTNYRDFALVGWDAAKRERVRLETYHLAADAASFWAGDIAAMTQAHGTQLLEFLRRVLLYNAPLTRPEDLAAFLASYARDALVRVERAAGTPALEELRGALEEALGIRFEGDKGKHFFHSTLVQTIFYGIFSAWVLWSQGKAPADKERFDWRMAQWSLHVPMISALFVRLATPSQLGSLGLVEVLDWAGAALNRVDRAAFFAVFETGHAVQYFYEPFLEAFDPDLRKALGVWYTPPEIVRYMVARVDAVLRDELGLPDGLADERVIVLDPCCGTGAYLVEVLRHIEGTLRARGDDALLAQLVKRAATNRVFGFEILPAPFVVAHLQLGMQLRQLGAPLAPDNNERAGVYLTNALTGWEPREGDKQRLPLSELEAERDAAAQIKRATPILVVLGNPPYNGFAGVAVDEERALTTAYRTTKRAPAPQGQGLNDLYVRFFRMAERRIVEETGRGVVCFISNYSWLDGLSYTGMRERYLDVFDRIWIDNLHGDRVISEYAPDGRTSETIFAMQGTSPGIKLGTSIALLVRRSKSKTHQEAKLLYRDFDEAKAADRRASLLSSLETPEFDDQYLPLAPIVEIGLPLKPREVNPAYLAWPRLPELFPVSFAGVKTSRDDAVVDIDRDRLEARMRKYFDPTVSHDEMRRTIPGVMDDSARFPAVATRDQLLKRGYLPQNIVRYYYRPFDARWLYWEPETKLLDEKRSEYFPNVFAGNLWIEARQKQPMEQFDRGFVVSVLADNFGNGLSNYFPLLLRPNTNKPGLFDNSTDAAPRPNLSDMAQAYLARVQAQPEDLFMHSVAIMHAPQYRAENGGALRQDWPRIPLPATGEALRASAALGRRVAALLDTEATAEGLGGDPFRTMATVARVGGGPLQPAELAVRAGWGHRGENGVTMPGRGRVIVRDRTPDEEASLANGAAALGLSVDDVLACLGAQTCDVYLNETAYWRNIPERVWDYTIGGYQVIKKWLSYREFAVLGRALTLDEAARDVPQMARRIAALLLLGPALDANYRAVQAGT